MVVDPRLTNYGMADNGYATNLVSRNAQYIPVRYATGGGGSTSGFWAVLFDKLSIAIDNTSPVSSDPLFYSPECPGIILPLSRGEYSWFEVVPNSTDPGEWKPRENGRFGLAGECDAAWEVNRSNANVHIERMIVWMWPGDAVDCTAAEEISSEVKLYASSYDGVSTNIRHWFNLAVPREDCANRYVISAHPFNDVV